MGFINKALVLDWEASGLPKEYGDQQWDRGPQGIEIGAILIDDLMGECRGAWEFTTRVKFVQRDFPGLNWEPQAERIHGITVSDLQTAAMPETVCKNLNHFLSQSYPEGEPILLGGQNPMFDRYFLIQLYRLAGLPTPRLHGRMIDTFSLGLAIWGHQTGDELFEHATGTKRTLHNSLGDARCSHEVIKLAFQKTAGLKIGF